MTFRVIRPWRNTKILRVWKVLQFLWRCWWSWKGSCSTNTKMVPLITCEMSLCQYVCELVLGVNVFAWILAYKLFLLKKKESRATLWVLEICLIVGLLPFVIHLDHCFVVFKDVQQSFLTRRIHVWRNEINLFRSSIFPWICFPVGNLYGSPRTWSFWYVFPWRTVTIRSQKSSAGIPSILNPASKEMIYDSVELCETEVCFLHIQLIGTNVWLPKIHSVPPQVDFESSRSPAKSESWNSPNLHCFAVFPTWQCCLYSFVWWM